MTNRTSRILRITALGSLLALGACEDQAARQRAEALEAIQAATIELTKTAGPVAPGGDEFQQRRSTLQRIARELSTISGDDGGQAASRMLLLSNVNRELADLSLAEVDAIETELQSERAVVRRMVLAIERAGGVTSGGEAIDLSGARRRLDDQEDQATRRANAFGGVARDLQAPMSELETANAEDRRRVDELADRANTLRREAASMGDADGFDRFQEAVELEGEIDLVEARIARREIDLDHDLTPQHELAMRRAGAARNVVTAVGDARRGIDEYEQNVAQSISTVRGNAETLRGNVEQELSRINTAMATEGSDLAAAYETTVDLLQRAAGDATRASRDLGRNGATARMAAARAHARLGQTLLRRAQSIAEQTALADAAAAVGAGSGAPRGMSDELTRLLSDAVAAYTASRDAAQQAGTDGAQLALRIGETLDMLDSPAPQDGSRAPAATPRDAPASDSRAPAPATADVVGPRSHEELIALLADPEGGSSQYLHSSDPNGRRLVEAMESLSSIMSGIDQAMIDEFGAGGGSSSFSASMPALSNITDPELVSESDDRAVYAQEKTVPGQGTIRVELPVMAVDGVWYVDFDELLAQMSPGAVDQLGNQATMIEDSVAALQRADIERRIRAGEFASLEEATAAMQRAMTE